MVLETVKSAINGDGSEICGGTGGTTRNSGHQGPTVRELK